MKLLHLLLVVTTIASFLFNYITVASSPTTAKNDGDSDLRAMMGSNAAIKEFVQRKLDELYETGASAVKLRWKYPGDDDDLVTALFALVALAESMEEHFPDDDHKDILLSFRNLPWQDAGFSVPRQCSFKCKV
ncbi:hypothetical protein MBANPS3_003622 [Mucor bainieri]